MEIRLLGLGSIREHSGSEAEAPGEPDHGVVPTFLLLRGPFLPFDSECISPSPGLFSVSSYMCVFWVSSLFACFYFSCLFISQSLVLIKQFLTDQKRANNILLGMFYYWTVFCIFCLIQKQAGGWNAFCSSGKQIYSVLFHIHDP